MKENICLYFMISLCTLFGFHHWIAFFEMMHVSEQFQDYYYLLAIIMKARNAFVSYSFFVSFVVSFLFALLWYSIANEENEMENRWGQSRLKAFFRPKLTYIHPTSGKSWTQNIAQKEKLFKKNWSKMMITWIRAFRIWFPFFQ